MTKKKALIKINSDELKTFMTHIVENNRFLQAGGKVPVSVNIEGDAGLGKTSVALQLSKELGLNYVRINLAEIEELGDLVGYPVRQFKLCKKGAPATGEIKRIPKYELKTAIKQVLESGRMVSKSVQENVQVGWTDVHPTATEDQCIWIDEQAVEEYIKRGFDFTGEKRMSYCPPEWITGLVGGGFLILDDYTRADVRFIQACMTLIETQKYISWQLPADWHIILTTNPDNGKYQVTSMDDAQKTRFVSVELKFDVDCWARWAESVGIDGRCINFMLLNPELVVEECNPRSITTFYNCISSLPNFMNSLPLIQMVGEGSVGPEFATMFSIFINNRLDKLITPKKVLFDPNETEVLKELKACIGSGANYRADIASILVTRILNTAVHFANDNPVDQKLVDRIITLTTDPEALTDDLKYVLIKRLLNNNGKKWQILMTNPQIVKISIK